MVYNVKVIDYLYGQQVRIYSQLMGAKNYIDEYYNVENDNEDIKEKNNVNTDNNSDSNINDDEYSNECLTESSEVDSVRSIYSSTNRTINTIYKLARSNDWEYFLTLTFNPELVDSFDYDEVTKKLSQWLNNLKKRYAPELKYILVPELHKSGRFHFHGLLANIGNIKLDDSGHRDESNNIIYNLGNYKLGYSTVTKINDVRRVSSYISKYITKDLCTLTKGKRRYWSSKNLDLPNETTYVLTPEEITSMINSFNNRIVYEKSVTNDIIDLTTTYYELDLKEVVFNG